MDINSGLWEYLQSKCDDGYMLREIYRAIHNHFPQLNEHTKLSKTDRPEIRIAAITPSFQMFADDVKWFIVSGWQKLKAQLMPPDYVFNQLDNPDKRWQYQKRVWFALFHLPVYSFWRIAGKWFNREDWKRRGMEAIPVASRPIPIPTETVTLEWFSWRDNWGKHYEIYCGYHPASDTLWVRD